MAFAFLNYRAVRGACLAAVLGWLAAASPSVCWAQFGFGRTSAVGGISIDTAGVVKNLSTDELGDLKRLRTKVLTAPTKDMNVRSDLRKVSLRRLEAALAESAADPEKRSDEIKFLAGLQRVQYIFVAPEQNDIILAGPAEGWKLDQRGNVVGMSSGRPVMMLDDLIVALRSSQAARQGALTCSIDPTEEGLRRVSELVRQQTRFSEQVVPQLEKELGMQQVTIQGVPANSHFAQVMLAADYRMKRLAMAFDRAPVPGLGTYLAMVSGPAGMQSMNPRWWLAAKYDALLKDPEGLAWQLRGPGVQCMTEDEFVDGGKRTRTGKSSAAAQRWADAMTEKYEDLSNKEPVFAQLRNLMDLAVVAALIDKENLAGRANLEIPMLLGTSDLVLSSEFNVPKQVPSIAKAIKKGGNWIISTSGGVEIASWQQLENAEQDPTLLTARDKAQAPEGSNAWWWD